MNHSTASNSQMSTIMNLQLSLDDLHDYVANALNEPKDDIDIHDNLVEWGISSLTLMGLITRLKKSNISISLNELLVEPTLYNWHSILQKQSNSEPSSDQPEIEPITDIHKPFPLTDVQLAYWLGRNPFFELGGVGAHGYIEVNATSICPVRLNNALNQTIQANPMLRAIINNDGEQVILSDVPNYDLVVHQQDQIDTLREMMEQEVIAADTWPLFTICLSEKDNASYLIHISFDILIFDLKSLELWVSKWWEFYENPNAVPRSNRYGFQDYVAQQSQQSASAHISREYWQDRIASLPLGPSLPLVHSTENVVPKFSREQTIIDKKTWDILQKKSQKKGIMPSSLLLAAYASILSAWSESQHFCLIMTLFNRDTMGLDFDHVIGDFTSLSVLEADIREQQGFHYFAKRLQQQVAEDLNHKVVSGVEVLKKMAEHHQTPNKAMLPFVFTSALGTGRSYLDAFSCFGEITRAAVQTPQVLIDHQTLEHKGNLILNWDYVEGIFPEGLVSDMAASHHRLLVQLADSDEAWENPNISLLPIVQEQTRIICNDTVTTFNNTFTLLHEPFLYQVEKTPENIALVNGEQEISYKKLDQLSSIIAEKLINENIQLGELVAVVMEKCWQQVVAVLGILKSGAAYIPVDALLPQKRIDTLLEESEARIVLLADNKVVQKITRQKSIVVNIELLENKLGIDVEAKLKKVSSQKKSDDLAYVIFTSGSTGKPKGVMLSHKAVLNTILDVNKRYKINSNSSGLMVSSLSFDLSVYDIFGLLGSGGKVVIPASSPLPNPVDWLSLVIKHRVNLWNSVPALLHLFYDHLKDNKSNHVLQQFNQILLSGDWLNVSVCAEIREHYPHTRLVCLGGATETGIWSAAYDIDQIDPRWRSIPIGYMANQQLYVLNQKLQQTPDWVRGELYIGGTGLGEGYWRDPVKTNAAFITHPYTGEKLYRTGDQAKVQTSGLIELLGRNDNQVKINGARVELGEVEAFLRSVDYIDQAVVIAQKSPTLGDQLYAFITCDKSKKINHQAADINSIEKQLRELLPQQLIPRVIKPLKNMPLNANGKVDRNALSVLAAKVKHVSTNKEELYILAKTDIEKKLLTLWSDLLLFEVQDVSTNFFSLGGSSLLATRLAGQINIAFNTNVAVIKIFEHSTIIAQASLINVEINPNKKDTEMSLLTDKKRQGRSRKRQSARECLLE
jgi:amino acid adenylation domain-containing protein